MADYYSDHYSATVGTVTAPVTAADTPIKPILPAGVSHASLRYKRATVVVPNAATTAEICYFFDLKTSDRLLNLYVSKPAWTATNFDSTCGVYRTAADGGAIVDIDAFCEIDVVPMDDLQDLLARVDILMLNDNTTEDDRGKQMWDIVNIGLGGATYTVDPLQTWTVAITLGTEGTHTVGSAVTLEAVYTSTGN